jgi:hypothetical protein
VPWFDDIDPSRPQDTEFVSEGAMRFRELKRALIERLSTAFEGFPEDSTHQPGTKLLFPLATTMVGTEAQRPAVPIRQGQGWFSSDTNRLWIADRNLVWRLVAGGDGTGGGTGPGAGDSYISVSVSGEFNWHNTNLVFGMPLMNRPPTEVALPLRHVTLRALATIPSPGSHAAHGVGSRAFVAAPSGQSPTDIKIRSVRSSLSGGERVYSIEFEPEPARDYPISILVTASFWLMDATPTEPIPPSSDYDYY